MPPAAPSTVTLLPLPAAAAEKARLAARERAMVPGRKRVGRSAKAGNARGVCKGGRGRESAAEVTVRRARRCAVCIPPAAARGPPHATEFASAISRTFCVYAAGSSLRQRPASAAGVQQAPWLSVAHALGKLPRVPLCRVLQVRVIQQVLDGLQDLRQRGRLPPAPCPVSPPHAPP